MNQHLSQAETSLRSLLHEGPLNSRDVLAEMAKQQFSAKQVRRARERQGVLIERAGSGSAMHSTWRLPEQDFGATLSSQPVIDAHAVASVGSPTSALTDSEHHRHRARVGVFIAEGLDALTACELADRLVVRDRGSLRAVGSCAECQNLALRQCPVTPRPVIEIHECWYRRQSMP